MVDLLVVLPDQWVRSTLFTANTSPADFAGIPRGGSPLPGHHVPKKCPKALKNNRLRFPNMIPTFEKLGIMLWVPCCKGRGRARGTLESGADFHEGLIQSLSSVEPP